MESILQQSPARTPVREVTVPQVMRPAVDLIARLAAERARLRDDLQRLRDDVTSVEPQAQAQPGAELDAVKAELARVTAERDALRREVEQLRGARTQDPFDGLLARLERVAGRLELTTSSSAARRRPASGRVSREAVQTPRSTPRSSSRSASGSGPAAAAPSQGGGMLGSLVAQNLMLRPGSDRAQRAGSTPTTTPRPTATAPQKTPAPQPRPANGGGGGGLLAGLVKQNLAVRSTPQGQRRAQAA